MSPPPDSDGDIDVDDQQAQQQQTSKQADTHATEATTTTTTGTGTATSPQPPQSAPSAPSPLPPRPSHSPPPRPAPVRLPVQTARAEPNEMGMSAALPPGHPGVSSGAGGGGGGGCPFLSAGLSAAAAGSASGSSNASPRAPTSAGSSPGSTSSSSVYTPTSIRMAMAAASQSSSAPLPVPKDQLTHKEVDTMLSMLPDALFTVGVDGVVRDLNSKACAMFGYPRSDLLGFSINQLLPVHLRPGHDAQMRGAFHLNQVREMGRRRTVRGLHADGSQLELSIHLAPFRLVSADDPPELRAERGVSLMLCVVRDITERTRLAMSRQRAANRARMMTEFLRLLNHETRTSLHAIHHSLADLHAEIESVCHSMQDGGRWADDTPQAPPEESLFSPLPPAGNTPELSPTALRPPSPLAPHQQLRLTPQTDTDAQLTPGLATPPTAVQLPAAAITLAHAAQVAPFEAQAVSVTAQPTNVVQLPAAAQLFGSPTEVGVASMDSTSSATPLLVSSAPLGRSWTSASVSLPHAPQLASSARSSSVVSSSSSSSRVPSSLRSRLESVESATERMGTLLNNMVDLQNLQSGNIVNQVTSFHPPALLQNLVDSKLKQAAAAHVRLQMYAPADLPTVKGNAQLLLKCLAALVDNAIKASQPGSRVVVRCHATHDRALMQATMAPNAAVAATANAAASGVTSSPPAVVTPPVFSVTPPAFDSSPSSLPPIPSSSPPAVPAAAADRTVAAADRLLPSPVDVTSPTGSLSAVARSNLLSRACASPHPVYRGLQGAKRAALAAASARAAQAAAASANQSADQLPGAMASMSLSAPPVSAAAAVGVSTSVSTAAVAASESLSSSPVTVIRNVELAKAAGSLRSSDSPGKLRRSPRLQPYDDDDDEESSSPLQPRSGRLAKAGSRDRSRSNSRVIAASTAAAVAAAAPASEGLLLELVFQVLDEGVGFGGVELERLVAPQARLLRGPRDPDARTLSESESDHESVPTAPDGMDVSTTRSTNGGLGLGIPIARLSVRGMSGSFEIRSTPRGKHATAPGLAQVQESGSSASSGGPDGRVVAAQSVSCCQCSSSPGGDLCGACLQPGRWSSVCELMAPFIWCPPHLLLDAPQQQRILRHLFAPSLAATRANFPVLVVEDNAINSKILVNLLKKRGFTNVVTAADGRLALEAVESRRTRVALANAQRMLQRQVDQLTAALQHQERGTTRIHDGKQNEEPSRAPTAAAAAAAATPLDDSSLENEHFSLILMDCEMPNMDGFECTTVLRAGGCTTPIVALTANATFACQRRCYECGMDVFLNKPLASDSLFFTIAALPPFHAYPLALSPFFLHQ